MRIGSVVDQPAVRLRLGAILVLTALAVGGCTHSSTPPKPAPTASPSASSGPVSTMSAVDASAIEKGLVSTSPTAVAAVLAPQLATRYTAKPVALWPPGSTITIDRTHLTLVGSDLATVTATVAGTRPGNWVFLLVKADGRWRVLATSEVK